MNLIKRRDLWDPFDFAGAFQNDLSSFFNRSLTKGNGFGAYFEPAIDVREEVDRLIVTADLPGVKKEELGISVEGNRLILRGERKQEEETKKKNYYSSERFYGAFSRVIELPSGVDADKIRAAYKDGVLEIVLPKLENAKMKQIKIDIK